jgi:hypothetical protein
MLRVLATVDRRGMLRKEGIETFSASDFHSANTPFRGIVFDPVGKRRSLAKQQPPKGILPGTLFSRLESRPESSCARHLPMRRSTSPIALNSLPHVARWLDLLGCRYVSPSFTGVFACAPSGAPAEHRARGEAATSRIVVIEEPADQLAGRVQARDRPS